MSIDKELLISCVKRYQWLYDNGHRSYKDSMKRSNSWDEIGRTVHATAETAKKTWNDLRDQYRKTRARVMHGCPSGSGAEDAAARKVKWPLYPLMDSFMRKHTTLNRKGGESFSISNTTTHTETEYLASQIEASQQLEESTLHEVSQDLEVQLLDESIIKTEDEESHSLLGSAATVRWMAPTANDEQLRSAAPVPADDAGGSQHESSLGDRVRRSSPSPGDHDGLPSPNNGTLQSSTAPGHRARSSSPPSDRDRQQSAPRNSARYSRPPPTESAGHPAPPNTSQTPRGAKRRLAEGVKWQDRMVRYLESRTPVPSSHLAPSRLDEFDAFGAVVAGRLRRMSERDAAVAQVKVLEVLNTLAYGE